MARNTSVMGIYPDRATVSEAVNVLRKSGFRAPDTSFMAADNPGSKDFGHQQRTRSLEGAAIGAAVAAVAGATVACLVSLQTLPLAALEPLVALGPVLASLAGAGAGGAVGWIVGLVAGMNVPEYVARRYAGRIRNGGILLSVHCDSPEWSVRAKKALKDSGARCISSVSESAADYATTDRPTVRIPVTPAALDEDHGRQPVVEDPAHEVRK